MDTPSLTVLVVTDFSPSSQGAVDFADALAERHAARAVIACVVPAAGDVPEARERLESVRRGLACSAVEVAVAVGDPAEGILDLARARACDLIVMGIGHGGSGRRAVIGSVAKAVLRRAGRPVVTVRAPWSGTPRAKPVGERPGHVLVPLDPSGQCAPPLRWASWIATATGATVELLHVLAWESDGGSPLNPMVLSRPPDRMRRESETRLRAEGQRLGPLDFRTTVTWGPRVRQILSVAEARSTDVIVVGTHGHAGLRRLLEGSIAESVARRARCPVMSVPLEPMPAACPTFVPDPLDSGPAVWHDQRQ